MHGDGQKGAGSHDTATRIPSCYYRHIPLFQAIIRKAAICPRPPCLRLSAPPPPDPYLSWNTTTCPSRVICTSNSSRSTPSRAELRNAGSVFSSKPSRGPPRWLYTAMGKRIRGVWGRAWAHADDAEGRMLGRKLPMLPAGQLMLLSELLQQVNPHIVVTVINVIHSQGPVHRYRM